MRQISRLPFASAMTLAGVLALSACGNSDYYLLPPPVPSNRAPAASSSVSVSEISLPSYADALEIASLNTEGSVSLADNSLWADMPRRALTRHLVAALQQRLGGKIGTEPWPGYDGPGLRLDVVVDQMIGGPEQPLRFSGQYILVSPGSGGIVASNRFSITVPVQGAGYGGLLASHSRAVDLLADDIAGRISGVTRQSS